MEETRFRTVGSYLLKQYFVRKSGGVADLELRGLAQFYEAVRTVSQAFKRRVDAAKHPSPQAESRIPFVEVDLGRPFSPTECTIEMEACNGTKMAIRLKGSDSVDVIALSSAFLGRRR